MTEEVERPRRSAEHFVRKLAGHHAAAFREFGDVLQRFGDGGIGVGGVVKVAGDLYFREVSRLASEMVGAVSDGWDWGLPKAGVEAKAGADIAHDRRKPQTRRAG
jgi:hypothetical protein